MRAILSGSIITTEDERNVNKKNCYFEKIYSFAKFISFIFHMINNIM